MKHPSFSRRQALAAGITLPLLAATTPAAETSPAKPTLAVGMATMGFRELSNPQMAQLLAKEGVKTAQLFLTQSDSNYWKYNTAVDVSEMTEPRCKTIAEAYRSAGVNLHSIGTYANLIQPDPEQRKANLAYFETMMVLGGHMGVRTFISEAGHYHPKEAAPGIEYHFREDVWKTMVETGKELAALAERHNATVLLEPFYRGFLASAKRTRLFIEEVASPRLRVLLDPANLLEINDLDEMLAQLKPYIDCFHAKDRKLHVDRGVAAGKGDLDYRKFVELAAKHAPHAPLILEYVGGKDYPQALAHLRTTMRELGIGER